MEFLKSDFNVKIFDVLRLNWDENDVVVAPRPYNAISFRICGNAEFSAQNNVEILKTGDILFMPENTGYKLKSGSEEIIVIHFLINGKKQNYFETFTPEQPEQFKSLFFEALEAWNLKKPGYDLRVTSIFYKILEKTVRQSDRFVNPVYHKIKPAVLYINENFASNNLNIFLLCNMLNMSDTYFRKLFFEVYKTTPNKYINKLRIDYSKKLLESGFFTVEQIGERCGFVDTKYFSTVFKKLCNCTPSEYKKQCKLSEE